MSQDERGLNGKFCIMWTKIKCLEPVLIFKATPNCTKVVNNAFSDQFLINQSRNKFHQARLEV